MAHNTHTHAQKNITGTYSRAHITHKYNKAITITQIHGDVVVVVVVVSKGRVCASERACNAK